MSCSVCSDRRRADIDAALMRGMRTKLVGDLFSIEMGDLQAHAGKHLPGSYECPICCSDKRSLIDADMLVGNAVELVASRFPVPGTDEGDYRLHRTHMHAAGRRQVLAKLLRTTAQLEDALEAAGTAVEAAKTADALVKCSQLRQKLSQELLGDDAALLKPIDRLPQFVELRGLLLKALEPYPDAAEAVAEALEAMT